MSNTQILFNRASWISINITRFLVRPTGQSGPEDRCKLWKVGNRIAGAELESMPLSTGEIQRQDWIELGALPVR